MKIRSFFVDPRQPDKYSMSRGLAFLFALAAIGAALIVDDTVVVLEFLAASTAALGVRSRPKTSD